MSNLPEFTVYFDFRDGAGFVDVTKLTLVKEMYREKYLWNNLSPTVNICTFKLKHRTDVVNRLLNTDKDVYSKIAAVYNKNTPEQYSEVFMEGILGKNFNIKSTSKIEWIEVQVSDFGDLLKKPIIASFDLKYTNTRQLVQTLLKMNELGRALTASEIANLENSTNFWNVVSQDATITDTNLIIEYFSYNVTDNKTYYDLLSEICLDSRLVFYIDGTAGDPLSKVIKPVFQLYQIERPYSPSTGNVNTDTITDIISPHIINKKQPAHDAVKVSYYPVTTKTNQTLFVDTTGKGPADAANTCRIPVSSGGYFPNGSTASAEVPAYYSFSDYDEDQILAVIPNGVSQAGPIYVPPIMTATKTITGNIYDFITNIKTAVQEGSSLCSGTYASTAISSIYFAKVSTETITYDYWRKTSSITKPETYTIPGYWYTTYDMDYTSHPPKVITKRVWVKAVSGTFNHPYDIDSLYQRTVVKENYEVKFYSATGAQVSTTQYSYYIPAGEWVLSESTRERDAAVSGYVPTTDALPPTPVADKSTSSFSSTGSLQFYAGQGSTPDNPSLGLEFVCDNALKTEIIYATPSGDTYQPAFRIMSGYPRFEAKRFFVKYRNVSNKSYNILKFKVNGTIVVREKVPSTAIAYVDSMNTEYRMLEHEAKYFHTQTLAVKLRDVLLKYYKYADFTYTFCSRLNLKVGNVYWLTDPNFPFFKRKCVCVSVKNTVYSMKNEYTFEGVEEVGSTSSSSFSNKAVMDEDVLEGIAFATWGITTGEGEEETEALPYVSTPVSSSAQEALSMIDLRPTRNEIIYDGWTGDNATNIPSPPEFILCQGDFRTIHLAWTRQTELTNLKHYQLQVSNNAVDWKALRNDGVDWKGEEEHTTVYDEHWMHTRIPFDGEAGRLLYYRVRSVTKTGLVSEWSSITTGRTYKVEDTDRVTTSREYIVGILLSPIGDNIVARDVYEPADGEVTVESDFIIQRDWFYSGSGDISSSSSFSYNMSFDRVASYTIPVSSSSVIVKDYNPAPDEEITLSPQNVSSTSLMLENNIFTCWYNSSYKVGFYENGSSATAAQSKPYTIDMVKLSTERWITTSGGDISLHSSSARLDLKGIDSSVTKSVVCRLTDTTAAILYHVSSSNCWYVKKATITNDVISLSGRTIIQIANSGNCAITRVDDDRALIAYYYNGSSMHVVDLSGMTTVGTRETYGILDQPLIFVGSSLITNTGKMVVLSTVDNDVYIGEDYTIRGENISSVSKVDIADDRAMIVYAGDFLGKLYASVIYK